MLHPGLRLLLWAGAILVLQLAAPAGVLAASGACVLGAGLWSRKRLLKLLGRSRWLLAALAAFFAWGTPGLYLWPDLGAVSPTREGIGEAVIHLARLTAIIALVSLLLERTEVRDIVSGLRSLLAPFGAARDRLALRLMLVLNQVEERDSGWRALLAPAQGAPRKVVMSLAESRLRRADFAAGAAAMLLVVAFWLM
ncbi:MAG: hypothetical protein COW56_02320 [Rhodocyclales bacterium CG17_big_fil_post_rev_8_21_14_2_50_68_7]|nr:MAG: hypothetical protein COW56_02320 [Rhodocyclales bacterium CG17_big_fil_post_rev_8_21_14_2_50_68_7]PJA57849.1 MAG: hypothetical protein CO164_05635 [Rhodocyclales bacterium CG_4_9_14_3_um_filter_68_10]